MQSINQVYKQLKKYRRRVIRTIGPTTKDINKLDRLDAWFRRLALKHLRKIHPTALYPTEWDPSRVLPCVTRYYSK